MPLSKHLESIKFALNQLPNYCSEKNSISILVIEKIIKIEIFELNSKSRSSHLFWIDNTGNVFHFDHKFLKNEDMNNYATKALLSGLTPKATSLLLNVSDTFVTRINRDIKLGYVPVFSN